MKEHRVEAVLLMAVLMLIQNNMNAVLPVYEVTGRGKFPGNGTQAPSLKFEANDEWKVVDMSDVQVKAGSPLDLSHIGALKTAGQGTMPRLTVGPSGKLVAEGKPDTPVRLRGFTFGLDFRSSHAEISDFIKNSRIQGYNLFRVYSVDRLSPEQDMNIKLELLDNMDYLISQMKQEGIYMHLTLFAYGLYMKLSREIFNNRNDFKVRMYLGDPEIRKFWKYGAETLMNHVNPYTGVMWKDDPVIACIEFYNEQEGGLMWRGVSEGTMAMVDARFRRWLEEKYKTAASLSKGWNDPGITSFSQVNAPERLLAGLGTSRKEKDFVLFCNALSQESADWCETTLRNTGYKGLTAQHDCPNWMGNNKIRFEKSQIALVHKYFNHPSAQSDPGSRCRSNSSVGEAASYWRAGNATRFADRPLFVTEYNHAFWNKYQHECGLVFGAYSALQAIDGLVIHERPVISEVTRPNNAWSVGSSPIGRANEFLTACLYLRGDVNPSPHRVELEIPRESLDDSRAVSSEQDKIGLLTGFTISFPWAKRPQIQAKPNKPDMVISPSVGAQVDGATGWATDVIPSGDSLFSLDAFVKEMKLEGVLSESNISEPSKGIFQSDTKEIVMRSRENMLKVKTLRTEAVTLEGEKGEQVGLLNVISTSTSALVATCSTDGRNLEESHQIVLVYSTEIANTDMELSPDRVTLIKLGKLPVLMKAGKLSATLKNSKGNSMSLYALGFDGSRREKLPVKYEEGLLHIEINTADLKNGPASFFELAVK